MSKYKSNIGGGWGINPFGLGTLCDGASDAAANGGASNAAGGGTVTPAADPATPPANAIANTALSPDQLQSIIGPVQTAVRETVTQTIEPLRTDIAGLRTAVDGLESWREEVTQAAAANRPAHNQASALFGGGGEQRHGVRTGEDPMTSRGFSMIRVIGLRQGRLSPDTCKPELEMSQMLHDVYATGGFIPEGGLSSILVPLGVGMLPSEEYSEGGLTTQQLTGIRQYMSAGVAGIDPDRWKWTVQQLGIAGGFFSGASTPTVRQDLSQFDDTGLGNFLGATTKGELIELIRAMEVFSRVGATNLTLPPNGRLMFDKHTGAVTAFWVGEVPSDKSIPTITASEPTTGSLTLLAKKLAVLVKLPNELIRFATSELEAFIRNDMARTMSLEADLAMIEGEGGTRIRGLLSSEIQERQPGTEAANGDTFEPEDVTLAKSDIEEANHDTEDGSFFWTMRPKMWANIRNRRAAAHTAAVFDGPWLFPINRDDIGSGQAARLDGDPVVRSTQISNTRAKGSSSDLTFILYGVARHYLIARAGVIEFATSVEGDTPFQTDQTWIRAIQHIDAGARYENAFGFMDDIDQDLP